MIKANDSILKIPRKLKHEIKASLYFSLLLIKNKIFLNHSCNNFINV